MIRKSQFLISDFCCLHCWKWQQQQQQQIYNAMCKRSMLLKIAAPRKNSLHISKSFQLFIIHLVAHKFYRICSFIYTILVFSSKNQLASQLFSCWIYCEKIYTTKWIFRVDKMRRQHFKYSQNMYDHFLLAFISANHESEISELQIQTNSYSANFFCFAFLPWKIQKKRKQNQSIKLRNGQMFVTNF